MSFFYCEIQDELTDLQPHRIPLDKVRLPLRVQAESFLSDNTDWSVVYDAFDRLCLEYDFTLDLSDNCQALAHRSLGNGLIQHAFVENRTNHFIVQVWTTLESPEAMFAASAVDYLLDLAPLFPVPSICSTLVMIEGEYEHRDPSFFFGDRRVYASSILDGQAQMLARYAKDRRGNELFVVLPSSYQGRKALERHALRTADTIIHMETFYHLITLPKPRFRTIVEEVRRLESDLDNNITEISRDLLTTDLDKIREWLQDLSLDFARLNRFKQTLEQHSANVQLYQDEVSQLLEWWKETPLTEGPNLTSVVTSNITRFSRDCEWLYSRISDISARVDNMVGILRTRIDILNQRQLLATEQSIHASLDGQLKTHHKIQGLYSIFCAFYLTEISYVVFEAVHEKGWMEMSAAMATAPLIPVYFLLGLIFSGTLGRMFRPKTPPLGDKPVE